MATGKEFGDRLRQALDNADMSQQQLADKLEQLPDFAQETTEEALREFCEALEVKPGIIINGMRTCVTGQLAGPSMFEALGALGQERVVKRLRSCGKLFG